MPSVNAVVFHAYIFGTAFWYGLRGACRVYDPVMVAGWFRPPSQSHLKSTDLEFYNIRTDGWCLITLSLIMLALTNAVPFSHPLAAFPSTAPSESRAAASGSKPYARAVVAATVFHHVTTGLGAFQHWKLESHNNTSMEIGVWGNVWLTVTGLVTLGVLFSGEGEKSVQEVKGEIKKKVK